MHSSCKQRKIAVVSISLSVLMLFSGCSIHRMTSRYMQRVMNDFSTAFYRQTDPELAQEGSAAFLIITDALIQGNPDSDRLLLAGVQEYTAYASAFLMESDPDRAFKLFETARNYGLKLLNRTFATDDFRKLTLDQVRGLMDHLSPEQVPAVYWSASAWGGWIATHPDQMEGLMDLSLVVTMMQGVVKCDPAYQSGGGHLFLGIYYCSRPKPLGGNPEEGKIHFLQAKKLSPRGALLPDVFLAKYYAVSVFDETLFRSTLTKVLNAPSPDNPDMNLMNALARRQAQALLDNIDEYF